jgi:hypothetical protein
LHTISAWTREVPAGDVRTDRPVDVAELYAARTVDWSIVVVVDGSTTA